MNTKSIKKISIINAGAFEITFSDDTVTIWRAGEEGSDVAPTTVASVPTAADIVEVAPVDTPVTPEIAPTATETPAPVETTVEAPAAPASTETPTEVAPTI